MKLLSLSVLACVAGLTACATPLSTPIEGYLCCNLPLQKGWVSSASIQGNARLTLGEPTRVKSLKRSYYAYVEVGGDEYGFSDDSAKSEADTLAWLRMVIVKENPKKTLDSWPQGMKAAVSGGKLLVGMSKEQVAMSIGYPSRSDTPNLQAQVWKYWTATEDTPVELQFSSGGTLEKVLGSEAFLRRAVLAP